MESLIRISRDEIKREKGYDSTDKDSKFLFSGFLPLNQAVANEVVTVGGSTNYTTNFNDIAVEKRETWFHSIIPGNYDEDAVGHGFVIKSQEPLTQILNDFIVLRARRGYITESFRENNFDMPWLDEGKDPAGVGEETLVGEALSVMWGNVPFSYKKVLKSVNNFGNPNLSQSGSYISKIAIEVGYAGIISQEILSPYSDDDPRSESWLPSEVFFGIHIKGKNPAYNLYIVLAHTLLYPGFFDENNMKTVVGENTTTKLILSTEKREFMELSHYDSFLGDGASEISIVGPSGIDENGDFNPEIFGEIPMPVSAWNFTTMQEISELTYTGDTEEWGYM